MRMVMVAWVALVLGSFASEAAFADDCDSNRKKLGANRRKSSQLQGKLRKLLVLASPSEAQKAELDKVQQTLGALSDQVESLEAALKACPAAGKAKAPAKAKMPAKAKTPEKPKTLEKAKTPAKPRAALVKPKPIAVVTPPPAPKLAPVPPPPPAVVSTVAVSSAPAAPWPAPVASEPVCSGGPSASDDSSGAPSATPPSVAAWRERAHRHAMNRRSVDWAAESPQRCLQRGAP